MASLRTKFTVGLFFVTGVALAIIAIIWLGMSHYLEEGHYYVSYFDESVQGLGNDSPVKYRGVAIGRVISIGVAPDGNLIEVVFKIESGLKPGPDMVARLKSIGITGIMFLELERSGPDDRPESPAITFQADYPVVNTRPSDIKRIFDSFENILSQFQASDIAGLIQNMNKTVDQINQALREAHVSEISQEIRATLSNTREIFDVEKWDRILSSLDEEIDSLHGLTQNADNTIAGINQMVMENQTPLTESITSLNNALSKAVVFMDNSNQLVANTDTAIMDIQQSLLQSADQIEAASIKLNTLLDISAGQPSQLLFGDPPEARPIETGTAHDP